LPSGSTEDGGRTWTKVLFRDADTGAVDIAGDAALPDVLYASLWQVRRHPWLDYWQPTIGPGSGIYKSTDGGRHWSPAGSGGLPTKPVGRISLGVAPGTSARRVWAHITAPDEGGFYRSDDGGSTWTLVNTDPGLGNDYMSQVIPDPRNPDVVWTVGRSLHRSQDGGRTFILAKGSPGGDDYHCLWIDPTDPQRMITGADQGAVAFEQPCAHSVVRALVGQIGRRVDDIAKVKCHADPKHNRGEQDQKKCKRLPFADGCHRDGSSRSKRR
jgi:hypothetical protein